MIGPISTLLAFVVLLFIIVLANAVRVVREYERLVLFRLGRLKGERGPGLVLLWPIIDRAIKGRAPHRDHGRSRRRTSSPRTTSR
jgi:regulator of protease activity HflC (stomatin/prohibitin superfamily)